MKSHLHTLNHQFINNPGPCRDTIAIARMFLIALTALVEITFQIIRCFLLEHLLRQSLRAQHKQFRYQVFLALPITLQQSFNLLLNSFTRWYSVHGVSVLSSPIRVLVFSTVRISYAAHFYSIIGTSPGYQTFEGHHTIALPSCLAVQ